MEVPDLVKHALTERDNQTWDIVRLAAVYAIVSMSVMEFCVKDFNALAFGTGVAAILAAVIGKDRWAPGGAPQAGAT